MSSHSILHICQTALTEPHVDVLPRRGHTNGCVSELH